jgi:hypothetical protein
MYFGIFLKGESKMREPTLIVMAAGMGSRYGGLKQMDPVTAAGEIIIDFSLYDAMMAGFKKVVFVIKKEMEADFRLLIDDRAGRHLETAYAFQELSDLPRGYAAPAERVKPWGTSHAARSCRHLVDGSFAIINADDFYGADAFRMMYEYLEKAEDGEKYQYAMVGYTLEKTLTEHGAVARGVCAVDENDRLKRIVERKKILRRGDQICFADENAEWTPVPGNSLVSMNFWGFTPSMMRKIEEGFPAFLDAALAGDALGAEYRLPTTVDDLLRSGQADVHILRTEDRWYGVTYKEDKPFVRDALQALKDKGVYPEQIWR